MKREQKLRGINKRKSVEWRYQMMNGAEQNTKKHVKITIIVSVRNDEEHLVRCIDSLTYQQLGESCWKDTIEILCIANGSVDGSINMLEERRRQDGRIMVMVFPEEQTALFCRKAGVEKASGEYILFLDAKDALKPGALKKLLCRMESLDVDILNFTLDIHNCCAAPEEVLKNFKRFSAPFCGRLTGEEFFRKAVDEKVCGGHLLGNKMYRAALLKKAFSEMEEIGQTAAEDNYAWFVTAYFADSYAGIQDMFYDYYYGLGGGGQGAGSIGRFELVCRESVIAEGAKKLLEKHGCFQQYKDVYEHFRARLLVGVVRQWNQLPREEAAAGFRSMAEKWGAAELAAAMCRRDWENPMGTAGKLCIPDMFNETVNTVKTVAVYYYNFHRGEVRWMIAAIARYYVNQCGYRVILVQDEIDMPDDLFFAEIRTLPSTRGAARLNYQDRARALEEIIEDCQLDIFFSFAWDCRLLPWDLMVCRLKNVRFWLCCHTDFARLLLNRYDAAKLPSLAYSCAAADGIVTLDQACRDFWGSFNHNVRKLHPPVWREDKLAGAALPAGRKDTEASGHTAGKNQGTEHVEEKRILWYGRMSTASAALDAVDIFRKVADAVPEAKLLMFGEENTEEALKKVRGRIREYQLERAVFLSEIPEEFWTSWGEAAAALCTGDCEGPGLYLLRSLAAGLPVVAAGYKHLELARRKKGVILVDHPGRNRTVDAAAEALVGLLQKEEYRQAFAREAQAAAEEVISAGSPSEWDEIWDASPGGGVMGTRRPPKQIAPMWQTLFDHLLTGLHGLGVGIGEMKKKISEKAS